MSLVVFGSVGRGTAGPASDLDLLVVASGLPDGRALRVRDFMSVELARPVTGANDLGERP